MTVELHKLYHRVGLRSDHGWRSDEGYFSVGFWVVAIFQTTCFWGFMVALIAVVGAIRAANDHISESLLGEASPSTNVLDPVAVQHAPQVGMFTLALCLPGWRRMLPLAVLPVQLAIVASLLESTRGSRNHDTCPGGASFSAQVLTAAIGAVYFIKTVLNVQQFFRASATLSDAVGRGTGIAMFASIIDLGLVAGPFKMLVYVANLAVVYATPEPMAMVLNMLALEFVLRFHDEVKMVLLTLDGRAIRESLQLKYETPAFSEVSEVASADTLAKGLEFVGRGILYGCFATILVGCTFFEPIQYTDREWAGCATPVRRLLFWGPNVWCQHFSGDMRYEFEMRVGIDHARELESPYVAVERVAMGFAICATFCWTMSRVVNHSRSLTWNLTTAFVFAVGVATAVAWAVMLAGSAFMMTLAPVCKPAATTP